MTKKRAYLTLLATVLLIGVTAVYQNCTGTRSRTADLEVSLSQAETYAQDLQCAYDGSGGDATSISAIDAINSISSQAGSQFFFGIAPSSMGSVDIVTPLDFSTLRDDGGGTPAQIYAFFALGGDGTASLVLALADSSGTTASATPVTSSTSFQVIKAQKKIARTRTSSVKLDTTTTCSSTTNTLGITTVIAALNNGSGMQQASFSDSGFDMELNLRGTTILHIHSDDVDSGSLQDTIQLEVYQVDPNTGEDTNYLGDINLTQPD